MKRNEIIERLKDIFEMANTLTDLDVSKITEDDNLSLDLGLTSVGVLYTAIAIEETFNVDFDDVSFNDLKTVKDVIDFIEKKVN